MFRDIRKSKVFNRRVFMVTAGQAFLTSALGVRLGFLQLYKHNDYSIQSDSNSIKPVFKVARRGIIYDRNGVALTESKQQYQLFLYVESKEKAIDFINVLSEVLLLNQAKKNLLLKKVDDAKRRSTVLLLDDMKWDDLSRVESSFYKLDGAIMENVFARTCLFPYELAHIVGYVSTPSKKDLDENPDLRPALLSPGYQIGRSGLEKRFDESLRGKYGVKYVEVNSVDKPLRVASEKDAVKGDDLTLTIDFDLQKFAFDRIKKEAASVVVMDVKSGEILACASSPSFDINRFSEGISEEYWKSLNSDPDRPLNNRAISAIYPPGSVFKIMTALAALEDGIDPKRVVNCKGHAKYGNRKLHCWRKEGHGNVDLVDAIKESCNIYFFDLAQQVGIEKINKVAERFGYGKMFDIGLDGSSKGNLPDDKWKRRAFGKPWVGGDTLNCAIGQGFVLATPLQIALAMARFSNGGYEIEPSLVKSLINHDQIASGKVNKIIKNEEHFKLISKALNKVVNESGGTAYYQRIAQEGFEMAGKTGTSQVISKREDEMSRFESNIRRNRNHAIFAGYAPVHDPKYSISVIVEHGGSGSVAAAPIAKDMLKKVQGLEV